MSRRVFYAVLIIQLLDRNYFQVQLMLFSSSLVMIYVGLVRPFYDRFANILELVNEVLVLLASYSLITFSALVPDA